MKTHWQRILGTPGFHRAALDAHNRWWMLDPQDQPYYARAVAGVNRAGRAGGRFAKPGPYAESVDRRYNYPQNPAPFVHAVLKRLQDWGFNCLGSWTTEEFFDQGLPWTEILDFRKEVPEATLKGPGIHLSDVFDPVFRHGAMAAAERYCAPWRECRSLVGYFTDNELSWGQPQTDQIWGASNEQNSGKGNPTLLQFCLALPPERPIQHVAWRWILERYGSLESLSTSWKISCDSPASLQSQSAAGLVLNNPAYNRDQNDFSTLFALEYFQVCGEAIRHADPNHLILGCRFGAPPGPAIAEAVRRSPWIDIVSANNYRDNQAERMDAYFTHMQKPLFIGEYSWASDYHTRIVEEDAGFVDESMPPRVRAAKKGRRALLEAFAHPAVLGYTWYRWIQNPHPDAEIPWQGYGLVDEQDDPIDFNVSLLADLNPQAEALRAQS
jgi:hypothetical protein